MKNYKYEISFIKPKKPWRYQSDSKRLPAEIENIHSVWVQFVERNITCFTINLNDAMRRLLRTG